MDKEKIKLLLESYRPEDADDPIFAEALRAAAADPELAAWLERMQRFDDEAGRALRDLPVPTDLKDRILSGAAPRVTPFPVPYRSRPWALVGAMAAMLVLGLFAGHYLLPDRQPAHRLEMQAITFTSHMPALQFVCFNAAAVAQWVNQQPGSRKVGLKLPPPDGSMSMSMIGSSVVDWDGHPVVMVCLQDGKRMAMLYVLKSSDMPELKDGMAETVQHGEWVVRLTNANGQIHVLAAKGRPEDLDFRMPFS